MQAYNHLDKGDTFDVDATFDEVGEAPQQRLAACLWEVRLESTGRP